jgi:hypothetical protein
MPRLSELQGAAPVRLSQVQAQRPAYQRVDPSTIKTEVDAHAAAFLAERAGDTEAAAALRARGDQLFADSMSGWDQFWAGAGKSVVDTGRGIGQLFGVVDEREIAEARAMDEALMNTGAGLVGNIAGQGLQMAVPLGSGGKVASVLGKSAPYVNAAARGAAFGGLQGTVGDESRAGNAALGGLLGAAGQGAADLVGRAARGVDMDTVTRGLLGKADDIGLRLNAGQLTQNPMLRNVMSQMERLPFSGGRAVQEANHSAFNRAVADTIGATDDKITADVFRAAKGRVGGEFERLSAQNQLNVTPELSARLAGIRDEANRLATGDTPRAVGNWIDELLSKADGQVVPGRAYQSFDSNVGRTLKNGGELGNYLGDVRNAVRGAMDDSIAPADQAAWRLARQQWGNLKTIEPLVAKSTTGDIPPAQLMGRVTADNAGKVRMASGGGGRLGELAQVGSRFLREAPDSATADRALVNVGVLGGLLGLQQTEVISPEAAALTAGLLGGNWAALGLLRNPGVIRGASPVLQGAARTAAAARTVPAAMGNARQRERTLEIDIIGGRPITLEEARRLQGL